MSAERTFALRGGGTVTETLLPHDADVDALYPRRVLMCETITGIAWAAASDEGMLLLLDERHNGGELTLLAFSKGEAAIDLFVDVVSALIHVSVRHGASDKPEGGTGGTPAPPPSPSRAGKQQAVGVPVRSVRKVKAKYDA